MVAHHAKPLFRNIQIQQTKTQVEGEKVQFLPGPLKTRTATQNLQTFNLKTVSLDFYFHYIFQHECCGHSKNPLTLIETHTAIQTKRLKL